MSEDKHFNCAEQVFSNTNERLQIPNFHQRYLKVASGFGGGVSRRGSICGAVSGGIMALGLKFGTDGSETTEVFNIKREKLRELATNFMKDFESRFGSVECRNLLGFELWTEDGLKRFRELRDSNKLKCQEYITFSKKLIGRVLEE